METRESRVRKLSILKVSSQTLVPDSIAAPNAARTAPTAPKVSASARIVLAGGTFIAVGILWDISWHRTIGRDTFWTPAHMAIYLGGLLGGLTCGWLVFRTTLFGSPEERSAAVRVLGFRGPLGAWVTIWGAMAMLRTFSWPLSSRAR